MSRENKMAHWTVIEDGDHNIRVFPEDAVREFSWDRGTDEYYLCSPDGTWYQVLRISTVATVFQSGMKTVLNKAKEAWVEEDEE